MLSEQSGTFVLKSRPWKLGERRTNIRVMSFISQDPEWLTNHAKNFRRDACDSQLYSLCLHNHGELPASFLLFVQVVATSLSLLRQWAVSLNRCILNAVLLLIFMGLS